MHININDPMSFTKEQINKHADLYKNNSNGRIDLYTLAELCLKQS